jgi:hypothetical protein
VSYYGIDVRAVNEAAKRDADRINQEKIAAGKQLPTIKAEYVYSTPTDGSGWDQYGRDLQAGLQGLGGQQQPQPTRSMSGYGGGNSGGGGRGYGGGGGGGINKAAVKAQAESLFKYDPSILGGVRDQANAYNPDIAGMTTQAQQAMRGFNDQRAQQAAAIMQQMAGLSGQVVQNNSAAMQTALRDLAGRGINVDPYLQSATQGQNLATQSLANQTGFMGQLNMLGNQNLQDQLGGAELVGQGAQGNLAGNRQLLLNQIAQQEAQQKQQLNQAKTEFLLKYGITT